MTGRAEPSFAELRENLVRRLESLEDPAPSRRSDRRIRRRADKKIGHSFRDGTTHTSADVIATETSFAATSITTSTVAGLFTSVTNTAVPAATSSAGQTAVTKANPPTAEDSLGLDIESARSNIVSVLELLTRLSPGVKILAILLQSRLEHHLGTSTSSWILDRPICGLGQRTASPPMEKLVYVLTQSLMSKRLPTSTSLREITIFSGLWGRAHFLIWVRHGISRMALAPSRARKRRTMY